jgi:hypothetical protein
VSNIAWPVTLVSILGFTVLVTGCASSSTVADLDKRIEMEKAQLATISKQLKSEAPPIFTTTHDLQINLKYRPLNKWLREITMPEFRISGVGVNAHGDIAYLPGVGKAWLEPAHDSKVNMHIHNLVINGGLSNLSWSAQVSADAEARAKFSILNAGGNILCSGNVPSKDIQGSINIAPMTGTKLPYSMHIATPGDMNVSVGCGLGQLGTVRFDMPIGSLASDVSKGEIDMGLKSLGTISLPSEVGGKQFHYKITAVNPSVTTSKDSLNIRTNIDVVIEK